MVTLVDALRREIGPDRVTTDGADLDFYAADIYSAGVRPAAVVLPQGTEQLADAVRLITTGGAAVVPRGGGVSYTGGVTPPSAGSVVVDTSGMNRILRVESEDLHVTVQAGCTWQTLWETLTPMGLRTPFWGPLSGSRATIGGSVSQQAVLWGSSRYGPSANSVAGLEVVVADGSVVSTGMGALNPSLGAWRHFGPDLSGVFLADCGALGVKATVTMPLMRVPTHSGFASFAFESRHAFVGALAGLARADVAVTAFGLDAVLTDQRIRRGSLAQGASAVRAMIAGSSNKLRAVREAARMAARGRGVVDAGSCSLHVMAEARSAAAVDADMAEIRKICTEGAASAGSGAVRPGGTEVEATVPRLLWSRPYGSLTSALGPEGQRWAPLHVLVPLSHANPMWDRIDALAQRHSEAMSDLEVELGVMVSTVSTMMLLEVVITWPGPRPAVYDRLVEPAKLRRYPTYPPNPAADGLVAEIRDELVDMFAAEGGAHLQIGRRYSYLDRLAPPTRHLLEALKAHLDPDGLMNPGVLGL